MPFHIAATPGAYGSLWQSETWIHYTGTGTTSMIPRPFCFAGLCPLGGDLEPNWPAVPFQHIALSEPAILVHIEEQHAGGAVFSSRVRDVSRAADSAGTEVPVIREDGMSPSPLYLLNVPNRTHFRSMLRIYALPDLDAPEVEVRYFHQFRDGEEFVTVLLRQDRIRLRVPPPVSGYRLHPATAEVGDLQNLPELASSDAFWVEIVPVTAGARIWAMISITNNDTQQFTLITPQR